MSKKYIFSDNDYISGDGMMTAIWGPPMWHLLHTISFNYPISPSEEQKMYYYNFYSNLQNILPCKYCRDNLSKISFSMDIFKNRDVLSRYIYNLHETINTMLGKTSGLCYEDVRDRYEHFRSRCLENPKKNKETNYKGCTEPLYGVKSKCVLNIVPKDNRRNSFKMDPKCVLSKGSTKESKKNSKPKKQSKKGSKK
jgi:hypothetical protein